MKQAIQPEINRLVQQLKNDQTTDGSWDYPFDTGIKTDAYMIILLRTLGVHDEKLIQALVGRIKSKQGRNGAWKLFYDQKEGDLTTTIEGYCGLLYSRYLDENDPRMRAAREFILNNGGLEKANMFTKVMLAITGQYSWPNRFPIPIEAVLLPTSFPINMFDISVFGRANIIPILILTIQKPHLKTSQDPDLSDLKVRNDDKWGFSDSKEWRGLFSLINKGIQSLVGFPAQIRRQAIQKAEQYMLNRIEPDGTFYSYFSTTFLMIFSLISLGYSKRHPIILKAIEGIKSMACEIDGHTHMQYTTADVWNTSLISYALQEAGISASDKSVRRANQFLLSRQHQKYGDWVVHNPNTLPGGWGFSNINTINPDVDDTTASLRALRSLVKNDRSYNQAWNRGVNWAVSMQNDDGGWPAFEREVNSRLVKLLPIEGGEYLLLDPSSADLTGRTMEFFGEFTQMKDSDPIILKGLNWLLDDQRDDGSWYGRWGLCYIYGTWAAVTGMV